MQLGMQPAQRPRDRPDRPRMAVEVCQEVAAGRSRVDRLAFPRAAPGSPHAGVLMPPVNSPSLGASWTMPSDRTLAKPARATLSVADELTLTARRHSRHASPDPASRRTASGTRSADALGDVSSNGATMKVLEGLKAIEPG